HSPDRLQRRLEVALTGQRLKDAVGCHHEAETRACAKWQNADVAAHERGSPCEPRPTQTVAPSWRHPRGSATPDHTCPGACHRHGYAARPTSELEDKPLLRDGEPLPE